MISKKTSKRDDMLSLALCYCNDVTKDLHYQNDLIRILTFSGRDCEKATMLLARRLQNCTLPGNYIFH